MNSLNEALREAVTAEMYSVINHVSSIYVDFLQKNREYSILKETFKNLSNSYRLMSDESVFKFYFVKKQKDSNSPTSISDEFIICVTDSKANSKDSNFLYKYFHSQGNYKLQSVDPKFPSPQVPYTTEFKKKLKRHTFTSFDILYMEYKQLSTAHPIPYSINFPLYQILLKLNIAQKLFLNIDLIDTSYLSVIVVQHSKHSCHQSIIQIKLQISLIQ